MNYIFRKNREKCGGTMIEIVLGLAILASLFILISSKIDIADIFAKLISTEGEVGVRAVSESISNYRWDNGGDVPFDEGKTVNVTPVCKATVSEGDCTAQGGVLFIDEIVTGGYIVSVPVERAYENHSYFTGYKIQYPYTGGRVRVLNSDETEEFVH
ncbi:hypothetical protein HOF56_02350 [Candidatus Peribacteria bacterium]|nr:hypothetical protein [Candidatus Peribacteria bacterium]MBT4021048.1 hypothetical protein [Candidatus Peribacteria bacterium]MBT4240769.1 hypothetical protein [Candidatus Peribacteria bacterium]MBT4474202.1 hypothetical protein [Candidatus Peribacteria bacterium]